MAIEVNCTRVKRFVEKGRMEGEKNWFCYPSEKSEQGEHKH